MTKAEEIVSLIEEISNDDIFEMHTVAVLDLYNDFKMCVFAKDILQELKDVKSRMLYMKKVYNS